MTVTLIWLIESPTADLPTWPLGPATAVAPTPTALAHWLASQPPLENYCLFWDAQLGAPPLAEVSRLIQQPGDVWHGGLALGQAGLPHLIDFVNPIWRFNRDPDANIEATSWRLSLQACLVRTAVLHKLGGPDPRFTTLSGASLELGHRWLRQGAFMRHIPTLLPTTAIKPTEPTIKDEFLFVRLRYGRFWHTWSFWRALATRHVSIKHWPAWQQTAPQQPTHPPTPLRSAAIKTADATTATITILIPTLQRYPHLFKLLNQLRQQTIKPHQIIVIDQTPTNQRQPDWPSQFTDLPLTVIWRDQPGQCTSRNAGLQITTSDYILFLDDDDEIEPNLIATHLSFLAQNPADASCGIALEVGAGKLPPDFTYPRASDVFPTNNSLLKKVALQDSGLFDLAYERGARADGDLGMRLYLAGKQLLLNPAAQVIHLHAPRGGLRHHKARAITRANSRASLTHRHLLSPTEAYLYWRYFSPRQVNEACLIRTFASLNGSGKRWQKTIRFVIMMLLLPLTHYQNRQQLKEGAKLCKQYPQIPALPESDNGYKR